MWGGGRRGPCAAGRGFRVLGRAGERLHPALLVLGTGTTGEGNTDKGGLRRRRVVVLVLLLVTAEEDGAANHRGVARVLLPVHAPGTR